MWRDKLKSYLVHVYPELERFQHFRDLLHLSQIGWSGHYTKLLRFGIPTAVLLVVLLVGTWLGLTIGRIRSNGEMGIESPPAVAPIPQETYVSPYTLVKQKMVEFNPALPDPLYPILDYRISVDPIVTSR